HLHTFPSLHARFICTSSPTLDPFIRTPFFHSIHSSAQHLSPWLVHPVRHLHIFSHLHAPLIPLHTFFHLHASRLIHSSSPFSKSMLCSSKLLFFSIDLQQVMSNSSSLLPLPLQLSLLPPLPLTLCLRFPLQLQKAVPKRALALYDYHP